MKIFAYSYADGENLSTTFNLGVFGAPDDDTGLGTKVRQLEIGDLLLIRLTDKAYRKAGHCNSPLSAESLGECSINGTSPRSATTSGQMRSKGRRSCILSLRNPTVGTSAIERYVVRPGPPRFQEQQREGPSRSANVGRQISGQCLQPSASTGSRRAARSASLTVYPNVVLANLMAHK